MSEPSKADQIRALIDRLEQQLKVAAGGVDPDVQAILDEMKQVLPAQS